MMKEVDRNAEIRYAQASKQASKQSKQSITAPFFYTLKPKSCQAKVSIFPLPDGFFA